MSRFQPKMEMQLGLDWDVDFWYKLLEPGITFETELLLLRKEEIACLAGEKGNDHIIEELRQRVDEVVKSYGGAAFVRLSS
jgi:hypothetical protein